MPTSEARIRANQSNSLKSTGPITPEGKERSRRNSLKHGLTGQGIVLNAEDSAEVQRRNDDLQSELAPKSTVGVILVLQMATLSVRMERGAKQEFAAVAENVRHAAENFDEARVELAENLLLSIGEHPLRALRKLRKMPEGVGLLIEEWGDLRADITRPTKPIWTAAHLVRLANLVGVRDEDARASQVGVLSRAIWGDFEGLVASEGGQLNDEARQAWARARMVEMIDRAIADLEAHYETLDHETIDQDRAEAGDRALFDPSKEASLARRYESEARRGFFKAMKDFRLVEAEAAERAASAAPSSPPARRLASSCESRSPEPFAADPWASEPPRPATGVVANSAEVARGADGRPLTVGRSTPQPN